MICYGFLCFWISYCFEYAFYLNYFPFGILYSNIIWIDSSPAQLSPCSSSPIFVYIFLLYYSVKQLLSKFNSKLFLIKYFNFLPTYNTRKLKILSLLLFKYYCSYLNITPTQLLVKRWNNQETMSYFNVMEFSLHF